MNPSPAPGQVWKYLSDCGEVFGVVLGQNPDRSWTLTSFSWWERGNGFLGNRDRPHLFNTRDFAERAEYIGLIANNPQGEAKT